MVVLGGLQDFRVSPSPLWLNLGFKLGWTGLGLGLKGLGTQRWVLGLDKKGVSLLLSCFYSGGKKFFARSA